MEEPQSTFFFAEIFEQGKNLLDLALVSLFTIWSWSFLPPVNVEQ